MQAPQQGIQISLTRMYQILLGRFQQEITRLNDEIVQLQCTNEALSEKIREYQQQRDEASKAANSVAGGIDVDSDPVGEASTR
jgi:signal transduction histidine kinase